MKLKPITTSLISLLSFTIAFAADRDSSATISSSTDSYQFIYNSLAQSVQVKQHLVTSYMANVFQAVVPVAEMYNDRVSISNVECKVDGKSVKDFKPVYTYYGSDDIFYSDEHICYFPLSIPKKGTIGTVTFDEVVNDPRYFTTITFSEPYNITHKEVIIKVPRWMKVELKEYNFEGFNIKKTTVYSSSDDADIITYTIDNLPSRVKESNSPGPTYIYPHLLVMCKSASVSGQSFTYFNTLDDQYKWYHNLVKSLPADNATIAAKAKDITEGKNTDLDKIKAIYYYVQDNIRYIAFEDGMAGFKPEKADEVLRKKYGDCKGMANLTKALLTALGYDARLCWLGTKHIAYNYQTPCLAVDNHMICALKFQNKLYFLDATESYIGFNEYAERIQGRQALVEDGDKYLLTNIPIATPQQNAHTETGRLTINGNSFNGDINHVWKGEDKEDVLSGLNSVKKEKTEKAMLDFLSDDNPDYIITGMALNGNDNPDKDLSATYKVAYKDGISVFDKAYYIDLDRRKEMMNAAVKIGERQHDLWFGHQMNILVQHELAIPAGYKVSTLPPALNIVNADYEFHVQYLDTPGKIIYKKIIRIKNTRLSKANFAKWNADIEQLAKAYNETAVLKPLS